MKTPARPLLCAESGFAGLPPVFALRPSGAAIAVLAPDDDPHAGLALLVGPAAPAVA